MGKLHKPRAGSLQYWPRKRVRKVLSRANWDVLQTKTDNKVLGFIAYKVGMRSAILKDNTPDSLTKGKNIVLSATILEAPAIKILSIRFYANNKIIKDVLNENLDKELKRVIKLPSEKHKLDLDKEISEAKSKGASDVRIQIYTNVKKTGIKKTPDICEIALNGSFDEKINFIKENIGKEISITDVFKINSLIDAKGLTKAFGTNGPMARMGIGLRGHKAEKGRRRPGNIAPWKPAHVTFRAPMSGQDGYFHRTINNLKVLDIGKTEQKDINSNEGFENFGKIKSDYIIITGNVPGTEKTAVLLTSPLRETKKQKKKNYQLIRLV